MDPANMREAEREMVLDEAEVAEMLMVKPTSIDADAIRFVRERTTLPVAARPIGGEHAQSETPAQNGWLNHEACLHDACSSCGARVRAPSVSTASGLTRAFPSAQKHRDGMSAAAGGWSQRRPAPNGSRTLTFGEALAVSSAGVSAFYSGDRRPDRCGAEQASIDGSDTETRRDAWCNGSASRAADTGLLALG
jgi:hypothetical protein